jgi:hypothetical protein
LFSQKDSIEHAFDRIERALDAVKKSANVSQAKWKIIVAAFTGHGFITFPAKESCISVPSSSDNGSDDFTLRLINLENFARECASFPNTITIIIDNSCRVYPKGNA